MKITNQQSIEIFNALNELANEKVPAKLAWKIQMGRKALEENVKSLNVLIADIQLKYAIRDENGELVKGKDADGNEMENTFHISPDRVHDVNKELAELLAVELEVSNVSLHLDDFPDTVTITANMITALTPILSEG
jgi:hypothetical protein